MKKGLLILVNILIISVSLAFANSKTITLKGQLKDARTQKGIQGVSIQFEELTEGTFTDENGNFEIKVPEGTYRLKCVLYSYQELAVDLKVRKDMNISYLMKPVDYQAPVRITAKIETQAKQSPLGKFLALVEYVFLHKLWE